MINSLLDRFSDPNIVHLSNKYSILLSVASRRCKIWIFDAAPRTAPSDGRSAMPIRKPFDRRMRRAAQWRMSDGSHNGIDTD